MRLKGYDYAQAGAYFVTLCSHNRERLFGQVQSGMVVLSDDGCLVEECWRALRGHFTDVEFDEFIVMPNHLHGLVIITGAAEGEACAAGGQSNHLSKKAHASPEGCHSRIFVLFSPSKLSRVARPSTIVSR